MITFAYEKMAILIMELKQATIDLSHFVEDHPNIKAMIGMDYGDRVRQKSKIDDLEKEYDRIEILIPADIRTLSISFLEGFFKNVVEKLGISGFFEKFTWRSLGDFEHDANFRQAVFMINRTKNTPLAREVIH